MNFLVTAIGSISSEVILKGLRNIYPGGKIIATDIYPKNWLWQASLADQFYQVPKAIDKNYLDKLFKICIKEKITFVLPLIDPEVDILSKYHQKFLNEGIIICTSKLDTIENCRDKFNLYKTFKEDKNVNIIPTTLNPDTAKKEYGYPIFAKPRRGRSSEGIMKIYDENESGNPVLKTGSYIYQPYISGEIFTVDVVRDTCNNCVCIPRIELIRNRIGEGITVEVIHNSKLDEYAASVAHKLDAVGAINIEFIFSNNTFYMMDVNPRFSAGVQFTLSSGYNIVENHIRAFNNLAITPKNTTKVGIYFKNHQKTLIRENTEM